MAITLGAGGIGLAQAAVESGDKPITVTVDSKRILDTRTNLGLAGAFAKDTPRDVQVTGSVAVATATGTAMETVVPAGATAVLVNVTVVTPTDIGFLTLRAGGATGAPTTSTVNFAAPGGVEPNAATVDLSTDGKVQVWVFMPNAAARADVLIDVVGYTIDHNHDDRYYTETEADAAHATKANAADVYTKAEIGAGFTARFGQTAFGPADTDQTVGSLNLPAGTYIVNAAGVANNNSGATETLECALTLNATAIDNLGGVQLFPVAPNTTAGSREAFALTGGGVLGAPGTANVVCNVSTGSGNWLGMSITAIQVATLTGP